VTLMTLHSAKGLEFESVFLVGLEEGLSPHTRSLSRPEALEEERRLLYVGHDAGDGAPAPQLGLEPQVFGQRRVSEPSRFLTEIPRDRLEITGESRMAPSWAPPRRAPGAPQPWRAADVVVPPTAAGLGEIRPGARVRHPLFGVGTVVRREGAGDDLKLTVSFLGIGAKRLVARFAAWNSSRGYVEHGGAAQQRRRARGVSGGVANTHRGGV
jgi:DNA helicase-2/ATP-dependent DNA helicase PcrA